MRGYFSFGMSEQVRSGTDKEGGKGGDGGRWTPMFSCTVDMIDFGVSQPQHYWHSGPEHSF